MPVAEPDFGYNFQDLDGYAGWHWRAGFGSQNLQEGDIVIVQLVTVVDPLHASVVSHTVQGITTDGTDWAHDILYEFTDPTTGNICATVVWRKVWRAEDDPTTYEVHFAGYPDTNDGYSETNINAYTIYGAGGAWTFNGLNASGGFDASFDGETFSRNFGDGSSSWEFVEKLGLYGFTTYDGHYPGAEWWYYEFPGVNVYGASLFGDNLFSGFTFNPADQIDQNTNASGAGGDPSTFHTLEMWDVLVEDVIRIAGNARRVRHLSVD